MALFRHPALSNEEKVYVEEVDSYLLPGQALHAQLCKFDIGVLFEIHTAIDAGNPLPATSFAAGDMVCATLEPNWARAEILKVDEAECLIDFVDFGAIRKYPKGAIYKLDPDLCSRWERVAIHILLKDDMQINTLAASALTCMDILEIGGVRYYHGNLSSFSEINHDSRVIPVRKYIPVVPTPNGKTVGEVPTEPVVVNGHANNPPTAMEISQPELNEIERVSFSWNHWNPGSYFVQLCRFDVAALEVELDTFYADQKNRKTATKVKTAGYFVAPYNTQFCRCFVLSIDEAANAKILYTDYGEVASVAVKDLLELSPGRFTEHPWAAISIETADKLNVEEEFVIRIQSSYKDPHGLPIHRVKICSGDAAEGGDIALSEETKRPVKPCFPPVEFNAREQELFPYLQEEEFLGAQLGQYTVEELESLNEKLTKTINEGAAAYCPETVTPGDLVAVAEECDGVAAFYRGIVTRVEDAVIWVYQVDFGSLVKSALLSIRCLPAEFVSYPQIGIRCELTGSQQSRISSDSVVVKNLRKKTHLEFMDIYEFDMTDVNGETPVVGLTEPKKSVPEQAQDATGGLGEPAPTDPKHDEEANPGENKKSEDAADKTIEVKDENHNYTHTPVLASAESSNSPNGSNSVDVAKGQSDEKKEQDTPAEKSEAANPKFLAEVNLAEVVTAAPAVGETAANGPGAATEKFTYEFASHVHYPEFSPGFENVLVSQKTSSDMMVMLSRFGLDYLHKIDVEIKAFLDQHPRIEPTPLGVGDLVILIREDYYRRAEIVKTVRDEFCVNCIDHGSVFTVPKEHLIRLPKSFEKYPRCAVHVEGAFSFTMGQEVDLILCMDNGKVRAKTRPSISPPSAVNDRSFSESVRSLSVSVHSDNVDDDDLKWSGDPEDPCPDKSFDVTVTSVHRASRVCVVRNHSLSQAGAIGEALKSLAQDLQPLVHERLAMGSAVVARLNTDPPRFRRAKIAHYNRATEMYKLFLVDSGVLAKLPLSNLFVLPAEFSLDRVPGYATILRLEADELAYDAAVVSKIFKGTLRCFLSYQHVDESIPGELCYEATLRNKSGDVVEQLNMKGMVSARADCFPVNPVLLPRLAESQYLDAKVVSARKSDSSNFDLVLLLVELKERLDRVLVDHDKLKNLYVMKLGAPALVFLSFENDPTPWKRARVIGRPLPGQYKLLLVDVGIEITHPVLKTFKCPTNLLHIPEAAVEISIGSLRELAPSDLQERMVVVKANWEIDYTTKKPVIELYDHDGDRILP